MQLKESTYNQLYAKTVLAFPNTTKRQHIVHTINIEQVRLMPFLGVKTLLVRSHAVNNENGHEYNPIILLKNVNYHPINNIIEITANDDGKQYQLEQPKLKGNNILIRCQCEDFHYRFNFYCHLDHSLYGRKRSPYIGQGLWEANPLELAGGCKHSLALVKKLKEVGFFI